jgi:taurine dioxygenase
VGGAASAGGGTNELLKFVVGHAPMEIDRLTGALGAEVTGVDLADDLTDETVTQIRAAFNEHHVLFFRDQHWTPEQQIAFGQRFGELDTHPFVEGNETHPEILDVITDPDDVVNFGGGWHTDVTFLPEPDLGSILYAVEVPDHGGDTLFANQHAAYDAMSDGFKGLLDGLRATHSAGPQYQEGGYSTRSKQMKTKNPELAGEHVVHPVIRTHPENGRKALYVNRAFTTGIVGLHPHESTALLRILHEQTTREAFTCRFRWEPGSVAMWDNRSVQHYAMFDYAGKRRHMRRVTIKGDKPV